MLQQALARLDHTDLFSTPDEQPQRAVVVEGDVLPLQGCYVRETTEGSIHEEDEHPLLKYTGLLTCKEGQAHAMYVAGGNRVLCPDRAGGVTFCMLPDP